MVKDFDDFLGSLDHEQEVEEAFERFKIAVDQLELETENGLTKVGLDTVVPLAVKLSNMTSMSMLRKYHDWLHS